MKLSTFLKREKVYDRFVEETLKQNRKEWHGNFIKTEKEAITYAFDWSKSKENHKFWEVLHTRAMEAVTENDLKCLADGKKPIIVEIRI